MRLLAFIAALAIFTDQSGQAPAFEAASVRQNTSGGAASSVGRQSGGRFNARNATLLEIIEYAYDVQRFRVIGGPPWMTSDRWDIVATFGAVPPTVAPGTADDMVLALRALLRDQFKLVVKTESRQLPVYDLVLARADRRLGPKMTASAIDCEAVFAARSRGGSPSGAAPTGTAQTGAAPAAARGGPQGGQDCGLQGRVGSVQARGGSIRDFAALLSNRVQRPVVDRTGLTGTWDFTLAYTPEASLTSPGALAPGTPLPAADPDSPSLFTALQEQLGLRLDSSRGDVEVLVIEAAERNQ